MVRADLRAVAALCGQLGYPNTPRDVRARFLQIPRTPEQRLLVAVDELGEVVGWIHAGVTRTLESPAGVEIFGLVVDQQRRGGGIGAALVRAVERWAVSLGIRRLRLRSNVVRERAHRFYGRLGFRIVKTQHAFEKRLRAPARGRPARAARAALAQRSNEEGR